MKLKKYQILLFIFFLFGCSDNKKKGEFYGHVKTVKEFMANSPANLSNQDSTFSVCKIYNNNGELIQANRIDGRINFIYSYKYDDRGRQIEKRDSQPEMESIIITTYKYDSNGNRVEEQNFLHDADGNEPTSHIINKYDNKGNKIEERDSNETGLYAVTAFAYDDKGNNIETTYITYERGADVEEDDDVIDSAYVGTVDTSGADSSSVSEAKTNLAASKNKSEKNEENNDTIVHVSSDKVMYKYDDKDDVIEDKEYDSAGKRERLFTYKYEFDSKNNWTKKSEYLDGKLIQITKREFEYY